MSNTLVISVDANGQTEFTRNPTLENMFDGRGDMRRVTEIKKHGPADYRIHWLLGPYTGRIHTWGIADIYGITISNSLPEKEMSFRSYEIAVKHEVMVLNAMRKAGIRFSEE